MHGSLLDVHDLAVLQEADIEGVGLLRPDELECPLPVVDQSPELASGVDELEVELPLLVTLTEDRQGVVTEVGRDLVRGERFGHHRGVHAYVKRQEGRAPVHV